MRHMRSLGYHLAAICAALLFLLPLSWVVAASLLPPGQPPRPQEWLSAPPALANYTRIFEVAPLGLYVGNSLLVAALAVPATVLVASWAGFAMAQLPPRERYALLALAIALRMVPVTALWLSRFVMFTHLQMIDSYWALLAPAWMGSSPLFVLLFYWSFRRAPAALIEQARLDGMGPLRIWARVAMPLAAPATAAVAVLTFVQYWSDFINPLLYLRSEQRYTLAVGMRMLQQLDTTDWPLLMAASVLMTLPVVGLFLVAQRAFWPEARLAGAMGR